MTNLVLRIALILDGKIITKRESKRNVQSWTKKTAPLVVIPTHIIVEK